MEIERILYNMIYYFFMVYSILTKNSSDFNNYNTVIM